jgi:hypothetical protein
VWPWQGDSLVVFDLVQRRLAFLDRNGELGHTALVPRHDDIPIPIVLGPLGDGAFVLFGDRDPGVRDPGVVEAAQRALGLVRSLDDTLGVAGFFPGPTYHYTEFQGRVGRNVVPFTGSTRFAITGDRVAVGSPDRYEVRILRPDGALERIFRRTFDEVRVTQADIAWLMERRLGEVEGADNQRLVRQAFRDLRYAPTMPAFGVPTWTSGREPGGPDILADAAGNLWTFDHYRPGEYRNRFSVFSPEGVWLGTVALPELFTPSQIGPDFILGTWTDDLGFAHIRRYRLNKP